MRLSRIIDKALIIVSALSVVLLFAVIASMMTGNTFAEYETADVLSSSDDGPRYVIIYDGGKKLIAKTESATVGEVLERANVSLNDGDKVEPGLDSEINADNYFVNIYRSRPVVIRDGLSEKYLMTASYDKKEIAREAGFVIYDGDEIESVPNMVFLEAGVANTYDIKRNGGRIVTEEQEIPFAEEKVKDYNVAPGATEIRQLGEVGTKRLTYNVQYIDNKEVSRELVSEEVIREPVTRIVAVGASAIEKSPLTPSKGVNIYTVSANGRTVERKETYYDLPMSGVMRACGDGTYSVRADGVKVDQDGYVLVAAHLGRYPRCSIVETSLGPGKVYDTGGFAASNPEQFDLATDWTNRNGV